MARSSFRPSAPTSACRRRAIWRSSVPANAVSVPAALRHGREAWMRHEFGAVLCDDAEGLVGGGDGTVDVGLRHRGAKKHVVPGMHIDAAPHHFGAPTVADAKIRIVVEQDHRHLRRPGLTDRKSVLFRFFLQPGAQTVPQTDSLLEIV